MKEGGKGGKERKWKPRGARQGDCGKQAVFGGDR